ncbi:MAG: hypothetical protein ACK4OM_06010 [Alphaproteobacteria bacterium]
MDKNKRIAELRRKLAKHVGRSKFDISTKSMIMEEVFSKNNLVLFENIIELAELDEKYKVDVLTIILNKSYDNLNYELLRAFYNFVKKFGQIEKYKIRLLDLYSRDSNKLIVELIDDSEISIINLNNSSDLTLLKLINHDSDSINERIKKCDSKKVLDQMMSEYFISESKKEIKSDYKFFKSDLQFRFTLEIINTQLERINSEMPTVPNTQKDRFLLMLYNCLRHIHPETTPKMKNLETQSQVLELNLKYQEFIYYHLSKAHIINSPLFFHILTTHSYFIKIIKESQPFLRDLVNYIGRPNDKNNPIKAILQYGDKYPKNDVNPIFKFLELKDFKSNYFIIDRFIQYLELMNHPTDDFSNFFKSWFLKNIDELKETFSFINLKSQQECSNYFSFFDRKFLNISIFGMQQNKANNYCTAINRDENTINEISFETILYFLQYARPVDLLSILEAYPINSVEFDESWTPELIEQAVFLYREINAKAYEDYDKEKGLPMWKILKLSEIDEILEKYVYINLYVNSNSLNEPARNLPVDTVKHIINYVSNNKFAAKENDLMTRAKMRFSSKNLVNLTSAQKTIHFLKSLYEELLKLECDESVDMVEFINTCRNNKLNEEFDVGFDPETKSFYSVKEKNKMSVENGNKNSSNLSPLEKILKRKAEDQLDKSPKSPSR